MMKLYGKLRRQEEIVLTTFVEIFDNMSFSLVNVGVYPMRNRSMFWNVYYLGIITMMLFISGIAFYTFNCNLKDKEYGDAAKHGIILIIMLIVLAKSLVLISRKDTVCGIIEKMNQDYETANGLNAEELNIVKHFAWRALFVMDLWKVLGTITGILFVIKSFTLMMISALNDDIFKPAMFVEFYFPVWEQYKLDLPFFIPFYVSCTLFTFFTVRLYMGFGPLVPTFILHACGQLELVKLKIERLFSKEGDFLNEIDDGDQIIKEFSKIIQELQEIYAFCDNICQSFTVLYELMIILTTVVLPVTAYQVLLDLLNGKAPLEFIMFAADTFVNFLIPSYYGDILIQYSTSVAWSLYSSGWERVWCKRSRVLLRLAIMRADRPLAIRTGFQVISLQLFAEMCKQSWGIFNVMLATLK